MRKQAHFMLAAVLALSMSAPAFAGQWEQDPLGWRWQEDDGSYPASGWKEIQGKWYFFDEHGYMQSSQWVENLYYLGADGAMMINARTPDGYWVGPDGKWNEAAAGAVQEEEGSDASSDARDYTPYAEVLEGLIRKNPKDTFPYFLYDINGDGVQEMCIQSGHSHAGTTYRFYMLRDGEAVDLGYPFGGNSTFYGRRAGGLYCFHTINGGYYSITILSLGADSIDQQELVLDKGWDQSYSARFMPDAEDLVWHENNDLGPLLGG